MNVTVAGDQRPKIAKWVVSITYPRVEVCLKIVTVWSNLSNRFKFLLADSLSLSLGDIISCFSYLIALKIAHCRNGHDKMTQCVFLYLISIFLEWYLNFCCKPIIFWINLFCENWIFKGFCGLFWCSFHFWWWQHSINL